MITIYTATITNRLSYICKFLLEEQLGCAYEIVTTLPPVRQERFLISYGTRPAPEGSFCIKNQGLLSATETVEQQIVCHKIEGVTAFFLSVECDFPFDIFSATFYLLSRYEEYLPHTKDKYGRYAHTNSIAYKNQFLHEPLVNKWITMFASYLQKFFPSLQIKRREFSFTPSYDIDIAYAYRGKGLLRSLGGLLKDRDFERFAVWNGKKKDPHDCYSFLDKLHKKYQLNPIYFFLVAAVNGKYDRHILPSTYEMQQLIKATDKKDTVGLHPSWQSNEDPDELVWEKKTLEKYIDEPVRKSRQHYIKMNLPETYQRLITADIKSDYSMGYGSINGFRASVASSFLWYDLQNEKTTTLRIHPFCFMDATCFYQEKLTTKEAAASLDYYYNICREFHGSFISIFHNNFLGTDPLYSDYGKIYQAFLQKYFSRNV